MKKYSSGGSTSNRAVSVSNGDALNAGGGDIKGVISDLKGGAIKRMDCVGCGVGVGVGMTHLNIEGNNGGVARNVKSLSTIGRMFCSPSAFRLLNTT